MRVLDNLENYDVCELIEDIKKAYQFKNNQDLAPFVKHHIPRIDTIDESIDSANFKPIK